VVSLRPAQPIEQPGERDPSAAPAADGDPAARSGRRRWGPTARAVAGLCALAFVVFVLSPVRQNHDAYLSLPTAYTLVHGHTFDLSTLEAPRVQDHYGMVDGPAGARVNYFPWVLALVAVPAVVALDAAHAVGLGPGSRAVADGGAMDLIGVVLASAVAALLIAAVAAIAHDRLAGGFRRRRLTVVLVAAGFAFGTGVWSVASRALWQHGPAMLALAVAIGCLQRLTTRPVGPLRGWLAAGAGAALAVSYAARPTNATAGVVLSVYVAWRHRDLLLRYGAGALAVALPWLAVNLAAFDALLPPYYGGQRVGWHEHLGEALAANLVSPNRGLLVFTPIVVLAPLGLLPSMRARLRAGLVPLDRMLALAVVLQWLAASAYGEKWWAGNSYGPRFLTDALVPLAVLAVPAVATLVDAAQPARAGHRVLAGVAGAALVWSVFTASQGALMRATACWHSRSGLDQDPAQVWSLHPPQALAGIDRLRSTGSLRAAVLDDCGPPT
jgi:hypothetical protein